MSLSPDQKLAAYFLGRRIAGQRRKQERVPVAYLYNGVRLPGLPKEWNPETHPYLVLVYYYDKDAGAIVTDNIYLVALASQKTVKIDTTGTGFLTLYSSVTEMVTYTFDSSAGAWREEDLPGDVVPRYTPFWTDHTIEDAGGAIYLSASEPVPVYE